MVRQCFAAGLLLVAAHRAGILGLVGFIERISLWMR